MGRSPDERSLTTRRLEAKLAELEKASAARTAELERQIAEIKAEIAISSGEASEATKLREAVLAYAMVTGEITITALKYSTLGQKYPIHQLERALEYLVETGLIAGTDETGTPAGGRGRAPRVYQVVGEYSDTARMSAREALSAYEPRRRTGEVVAVTDEPETTTRSKKSKPGAK